MAKIYKKEKVKLTYHPPLSKIKLKSADEVSEFAENIINTVREPLLLLDKELRVIKASRSFYDFFKVSSDETIGKFIYDLGNQQWNIPKLRELLETILSEKTTFDNYEVEHDFSTIGKRIMLLNARQIERALRKEKIILLAMRDITERKRVEINSKEEKVQIEAQNEKFVQIGKELAFQKEEKKKRAVELIIADQELAFQTEEKEKRAAELIIADKELAFQTEEKEKRAAELIIADKELAFQTEEKEKRAAELIIANKELVFQNREKEKRADELFIANKELAFQNEEKEKRAAELILANEELVFQNLEKEKRAAELIVANKELAFQNLEKEKRAAELIVANKELGFQSREKEKRADELFIANKELAFQNEEKEKRASELIIANEELIFQNEEKGKRAAELILANEELVFQSREKEKRADELFIANKELAFQNEEKEKRAAELILANEELVFQNREKEKRASELILANEELVFQNREKEKRAAELIVANKELVFQNREKEKRADELFIANKELAFQNEEKEKRASELIIANEELAFQNEEKEKRAAELILANEELVFQNLEKEKRAAELIVANKELIIQNREKEKREDEIKKLNQELEERVKERTEAMQKSEEQFRLMVESVQDYAIIMLDSEGYIMNWNAGAERFKGYRADEIIGQHFKKFYTGEDIQIGIPAMELEGAVSKGRFENEGWRVRKDGSRFWASVIITALHDMNGKLLGFSKITKDITERKHAEEAIQLLNTQLEVSNKELEAFSYSVSHDLRAPLRHIDGFIELLKKKIFETADDSVKRYLDIISQASKKLSCLIDELLTYSRTGRTKLIHKEVDLNELVKEVITELTPQMENRKINWQIDQLPKIQADYNLIKLVYQNLIGNSIKFTGHKEEAVILLTAKEEDERHILTVKDTGAGFDMAFSERLFGVFQRLHRQDEFEGIGIGLANVRRIVQMHSGEIWAKGKVNKGAEFSFTIPKEFNKR